MADSRDENRTRGNWSSKWDYLLTLVGYSIGVNNVWRFPYLCYQNGGGAFLLPYILMVFVIGMPLFLLESALGQFTSSGCITVYNAVPVFRGAGYASIIVGVLALIYYNMVVAYPLVYIVYSIMYSLPPWASCDNPWNTQHCTMHNTTVEHQNISLMSPAEEFFHYKVLQISGGIDDAGNMLWSLVLASFIVNFLVFIAIFKGVKVVGKVVWFTALFPYVMMAVLFVRGVTLPGAWQGIYFFIVPDFNQLTQPNVWVDAAVQVFFSMGPGFGTLMAMGSLNKFRYNLLFNVIIIPIINTATSLFAGFVVFSVLGFMAHQINVQVSQVVSSGLGLAFITYPQALAMLPMSNLWTTSFFIMLFLLGLDSCFAVQEAAVVSLIDAWPKLRPYKERVALALCTFTFTASLMLCCQNGIYLLALMDNTIVEFTVVLSTLLMTVAFIYIYGVGRLFRDLQMMLQKSLSYFWYITWICFTPIVLSVVFITLCCGRWSQILSYGDYIMPQWTYILGWIFSLSSASAIPLYFIIHLYNAKGSYTKRLVSCFTPTCTWGPAVERHRAEWQEYCSLHKLPHRYSYPNSDCCNNTQHSPSPHHYNNSLEATHHSLLTTPSLQPF